MKIKTTYSAILADEEAYLEKIEDYKFQRLEDPFEFFHKITGRKVYATLAAMILIFAATFIAATATNVKAKKTADRQQPTGQFCGTTEKLYEAGWGNDCNY